MSYHLNNTMTQIKCQEKRIPWNKGKKLGYLPPKSFKKGNIPWNKGKKGFTSPKKGKHYLSHQKENHWNWQGGRIEKRCINCEKVYFIPKSIQKKSKYCSRKCMYHYKKEFLISLMKDASLRQQVGDNGKVKSQQYRWAHVAQSILDYYKRILAKTSSGG